MYSAHCTFVCITRSTSNISGSVLRNWIKPQSWTRGLYTTSPKALLPYTNAEFFEKNKRLNRPLSPHLTIYKPQLTSLLSVTHRGTGVYLSMILSGFSIGMLSLPGSFPHYLSMVEAMHLGSFIIFVVKFGLAFPFLFHSCNGVRHLMWDLGYGFSLKSLYKSGYFVLGSSTLLSALLAAL